ncbi:MAG TPA: thioesterase family protein [Kofleriaceae bacterium]|nr:thioesterase family protein [Kofleriaceae bacterium]
MSSAEIPFRFLLRVRYGEVDAQKIVFNARYADYVDIAVTEYQRALWTDVLALDMKLVKQTIEWKASARFDDVLEARVRTERVGTSSFTIATELRRWPDGPVLVNAETIYVATDDSGAKIAVPPRFRDALERGAVGVMVDHAGALR